MQWQKWMNTMRHNFWAPFFSRESVSGVLLYLPIHMVAPQEVFSSPALSPPRVPKAWRRTFSDTDRAQDIYKSQQSRAVKWEHLHNNNKKIKKKVTVRNQPVRKQLWGEELPGKHRETCLHGAEVWLQRTESAERRLHRAQKGDQSQASGVRAELEPESRRRWLGVRCQHRQQAQAAQHETLPSFEHSHNALTDSHSWEMQRGVLFQLQAVVTQRHFPASLATRSSKDQWWERLKDAPFVPPSLHLSKEHWHLLLWEQISAKPCLFQLVPAPGKRKMMTALKTNWKSGQNRYWNKSNQDS